MDDELKELQDLWQGQKASPRDIQELIGELNGLEAKLRKEKRKLLVLFPTTMLVLIALLAILPKAPLYIAGISLIGLAMLMVLFLSYRNSFPPVSQQQDMSNEVFLQETIDKLMARKLLTSRYMWIYTALLVLGLNIGYIDVLSEAGLTFRILGHGFVSIFLPIGNYFAIKKRMAKYEEELDPLIEQLESLKDG